MISNLPSDIFTQYEQGISYKNTINLYKSVDEAHRLFNGDQWAGLSVKNMPKPVFNLIKRVIQYKISALKSNAVARHTMSSMFRGTVIFLLSMILNIVWDVMWMLLQPMR